jgi:hypothetical protein
MIAIDQDGGKRRVRHYCYDVRASPVRFTPGNCFARPTGHLWRILKRRFATVIICVCPVCFWHKADISKRSTNVRLRGNSGPSPGHALISVFDPTEKSSGPILL